MLFIHNILTTEKYNRKWAYLSMLSPNIAWLIKTTVKKVIRRHPSIQFSLQFAVNFEGCFFDAFTFFFFSPLFIHTAWYCHSIFFLALADETHCNFSLIHRRGKISISKSEKKKKVWRNRKESRNSIIINHQCYFSLSFGEQRHNNLEAEKIPFRGERMKKK